MELRTPKFERLFPLRGTPTPYARMMGFDVVHFDEPLAEFIARPPNVTGREVWLPRLPETLLVVLGSGQSEAQLDIKRLKRDDIEIIRRRSGGGAVLVSAAELVWFDVLLDRDDELWQDDLGRSFDWLGHSIAEGIAALGYPTEVSTSVDREAKWAGAICFAGLGYGEVLIDGRKAVGISQRRTRTSARFQVGVLRRWNGAANAALLNVDETTRASVERELATAARGIADPPEQIVEAILKELP